MLKENKKLYTRQCCGSGMFFRIRFFSIRIPNPRPRFKKMTIRIRNKELSIFTPKLFLSSKNHLGCSFRIRIFCHPGFRGQRHWIPDSGSGSATLLPGAFCYTLTSFVRSERTHLNRYQLTQLQGIPTPVVRSPWSRCRTPPTGWPRRTSS